MANEICQFYIFGQHETSHFHDNLISHEMLSNFQDSWVYPSRFCVMKNYIFCCDICEGQLSKGDVFKSTSQQVI